MTDFVANFTANLLLVRRAAPDCNLWRSAKRSRSGKHGAQEHGVLEQSLGFVHCGEISRVGDRRSLLANRILCQTVILALLSSETRREFTCKGTTKPTPFASHTSGEEKWEGRRIWMGASKGHGFCAHFASSREDESILCNYRLLVLGLHVYYSNYRILWLPRDNSQGVSSHKAIRAFLGKLAMLRIIWYLI